MLWPSSWATVNPEAAHRFMVTLVEEPRPKVLWRKD